MSSRGKKKKIRNNERKVKYEQFEKSQAEMRRFLKLIENKSGQSCSIEDVARLIELSK